MRASVEIEPYNSVSAAGMGNGMFIGLGIGAPGTNCALCIIIWPALE